MYSYLQQASASTSGGATSQVNAVFGNPISAGSWVVVGVAFENEAYSATVVDGAGNALTPDTKFSNAADHWNMQWFSRPYAAAPGTATFTLTIKDGGGNPVGVASKGIWAVEYPGLNLSAVLQGSWNRQVAPGTTAGALNSGLITPVAQPYLLATLSMSKTGTANAVPTVDGSYNNRFTTWTFAGGSGNCARWADKEGHDFTANESVLTAGVGTDTYYTGAAFIQEFVLPNTYIVNPLGFAYSSTAGMAAWSHPSGMFVSGRTNRYAASFASARLAGAEHLAYFDLVERPDVALGGIDDAFYYGNPANCPLWPYPIGSPGTRVNYAGTHLTDITVGSAWTNYAVNYIIGIMREGKVDGAFLDVLGAQLFASWWAGASQAEKDAWTLGCIDLARRLDVARRQINPNFILVNNNTWDRGDSLGFGGEQYVDGVCLEHPSESLYHFNYLARNTFSNLGHRRMLVIAATTGQVPIWAAAQGVTNVSDQTNYSSIDSPQLSFVPVTDRPVSNTTCGAVDIYDNGNGSILVAWPAFPGTAPPASYNVYVNGVLNQNVVAPSQQAVISGLKGASYNLVTVTAPQSYDIKVVAVNAAGVETAASLDRVVTVQPTSIMLTTPMKRPFPFPNTDIA